MRVLVIDPYRHDIVERDIPKSLKGIQDVVHGRIQYVTRLRNGDVLYVNEDALGRFDAHFALDKGEALPGFGVVVGSSGPERDEGPARSSVDELRARIRYLAPFIGAADGQFAVGQHTGLAVPGAGANGAAVIFIGGNVSPQSMVVLAELSKPSVREIETFETGKVRVAVARRDSATILTWRFVRPADGKSLWFETPFHIGIQEAGTRYLLPRETADHGRMVRMVLQDERTNCRVSRTCVIPPEASYAVEEAVVDQVIDAATDPAFHDSYQVALQRYFAETPTPSSGFEQASNCLPTP
ncbi:hypothetical protein [Bradyrhizobium sp. dw_411]|uniref:DUF3846 domain-containing protein n=1 Tax=Bradyrhizobium sp. dw_411 TaxID=2720082 RepID=UPI001BCBC594|nr:hypothetical protein [Bradyrhizobium sp. dw_411]